MSSRASGIKTPRLRRSSENLDHKDTRTCRRYRESPVPPCGVSGVFDHFHAGTQKVLVRKDGDQVMSCSSLTSSHQIAFICLTGQRTDL